MLKWVCEKLISHYGILNVLPVENQLIKLQVKEYKAEVFVAVMSQIQVFLTDIPLVCKTSHVDFLLNIPKNSCIDGKVLSYAEYKQFGVGGLGDLYTAINEKNFHQYIPKETRFIMRGLNQHNRVSGVERINNRLYLVNRFQKAPLKILALNDYDLTADAVRTGVELYGECHLILTSNPNCRVSEEAESVARFIETPVLSWGELMRVINNV